MKESKWVKGSWMLNVQRVIMIPEQGPGPNHCCKQGERTWSSSKYTEQHDHYILP